MVMRGSLVANGDLVFLFFFQMVLDVDWVTHEELDLFFLSCFCTLI